MTGAVQARNPGILTRDTPLLMDLFIYMFVYSLFIGALDVVGTGLGAWDI